MSLGLFFFNCLHFSLFCNVSAPTPSLSGSETDVSTSTENLSYEEQYVMRTTTRQEPQGQENRNSLDSASYNTLIIHEENRYVWYHVALCPHYHNIACSYLLIQWKLKLINISMRLRGTTIPLENEECALYIRERVDWYAFWESKNILVNKRWYLGKKILLHSGFECICIGFHVVLRLCETSFIYNFYKSTC